jgi:hypothetical protein
MLEVAQNPRKTTQCDSKAKASSPEPPTLVPSPQRTDKATSIRAGQGTFYDRVFSNFFSIG